MKTVSLTLEEAHDGKEIEVVYDRIVSGFTSIELSKYGIMALLLL